MFMSWDNYDENEHRNLLSLQKYFFAAQKVLAESAGFVRQFLVDDKGDLSLLISIYNLFFIAVDILFDRIFLRR